MNRPKLHMYSLANGYKVGEQLDYYVIDLEKYCDELEEQLSSSMKVNKILECLILQAKFEGPECLNIIEFNKLSSRSSGKSEIYETLNDINPKELESHDDLIGWLTHVWKTRMLIEIEKLEKSFR